MNDKHIPNFDYASLYPTIMRYMNDDRTKMIIRRKKLDKILNNIDNG